MTSLSTVTEVAVSAYQGTFVLDNSFPWVTDQGANTYDANTIYATDGNSVFVSKDGGTTWKDRTTDLTGLGAIVDIEVDPRNRDIVYAVRDAFGNGQIFQSVNAGQSWTDISGNLPNLPTWKLVIDPRQG